MGLETSVVGPSFKRGFFACCGGALVSVDIFRFPSDGRSADDVEAKGLVGVPERELSALQVKVSFDNKNVLSL